MEDQGDLRKFIKNEKMINVLKNNGIKSLFPIQYRTFNSIFEGKDLKGKDKTGSGKTLAFSLPVIERFRKDDLFRDSKNPKFLIVLPTR
jgi:ATP-dependent RNA helicase DDX21